MNVSKKMISLSGTWKITRDAENTGKQNGWANAIRKEDIHDITVPEHIKNSEWEMHLSYANVFPKYHGYVWYYKEFDAYPEPAENERLLIEFERAAYLCEVYINGEYVGEHRHQEKSFFFDITDKVKKNQTNLLAVRCFEPRPIGKEIDGINLCDIPNSCWAQTQAFAWGSEDTFCLECVGGILGAVHLRTVPEIRVSEVYVRPFYETGEVDITVSITNAGKCVQNKEISAILSDWKSGTVAQVISECADIPVGESEVVLHGKIENHQLWELDSPVLYLATVAVDGKDHRTARFGFKDFRIKNGFYFLNGKRIFLKGAHSATCTANAISMKALGFNMIRTIARAFSEETLNVCDEIGLLVMDAAATGWGMFLHENSRAQIEGYNEDMIKASRNHPSVAIYCLVNELEEQEELFSYSVESLPKLRALAPDTLFLLHSGRWDRDISLGSASNPGSDKWDTYLGAEGIIAYPNRELPMPFDGYQDPAMGHIHIYMHVPVSAEVKAYLRKIGHDVRPIFIGESGIASQQDPMGEYLAHSGKKLKDAITIEKAKESWDETEEFLDFYDLRGVYPLAFDFSRDTEKLNGAQRSVLYNIYRSNPMINGFSFTSFGVGHEGTLQGNRVIKDSLAYAIEQGNEPLRWSLFSSERCVFANKPFEIEAVLCNEDVLTPGKYAAKAYIRGKDGCVWEKEFTVDYPDYGYGGMPPLAAQVLKEKVSLPAGEYVFSARLLQGGVAYDGDLKITVAGAEGDIDREITVCGVSEPVRTFLEEHGAKVHELSREDMQKLPSAVLVGNPESAELWDVLHALAERGSNIVFINPEFFKENENILKEIAGDKAYVRNCKGTIYHHDNVNIAHPIFSGIKDAGVLEFDKFGIVYPEEMFHSADKPTKTVCAALRIDTSYTTPGLTIGEYAAGEGKYVLNSFRIEPAVGKHPYADIMLMNIINTYFS